ncbi:23S rRNA (adenine(1618)-N(6))-methyltransferase RlmF [Motilimonas eburnea]|uniref:23S rRNA (adenine(1618)-N(6))-methyltransferase RlmF n=1 Tax=Motilimonas eburnea TaxID=1737488 RepID=UPI001E45F124|nr:23S rRNA (adenine(1618)-N(6))-methyltransferase RlmF [Motilimonas eburnea]MCE2569895.1 23S rRNA (adenine(1618)-N(6))-methyltransferase RlmF [Motilimonas eburnea]
MSVNRCKKVSSATSSRAPKNKGKRHRVNLSPAGRKATSPQVDKVKARPGAAKAGLHQRNPHQGRYNMAALTQALPELKQYLRLNPRGEQTIDFANEQAVLCLNQAILAHYYKVKFWQIPKGYLCPPIPGRADHIHHISELLAKLNHGKVPTGSKVKLLDIGTGANCIYPIIASQSYGWHCLASDIDPVSVNTANAIVKSNAVLTGKVEVKLQSNPNQYFKGIISADDKISLTLCNPPFHSSLEQGYRGSQRKWQNLSRNKGNQHNKGKGHAPQKGKPQLNFGGQQAELWCPGGELAFVKGMINESRQFADQVCWFTSLIAKGEHVRPLKKQLAEAGAAQVEILQMQQGQKISRIVAWSFQTPAQQGAWKTHW